MTAMIAVTRILTCCLGLALALVASAAESQFWIVLGSYQKPANAEAARAEASALEPLTAVAFDTSGGRWHRLLLGPYSARDQAAAMLADARSNGHPGAWLLAGGGGEVLPSAGAPDSTDEFASFAGVDESDEFDDWESLGPYDDLGGLEELPPLPEADGHLLSEQYKRPVSEPPPGYQLHRLRRSQP